MSRWQDRRARFRGILEQDRCIVPASLFDPASARIAEHLGFEAGMLPGSLASFSVLAAPDLIVVTLSELVEQARRICRAGALPLMVDADHGYGNALNVMRTVEELEAAGVCGLSIEDTDLPARDQGKPQLLSAQQGAAKVRAAIEARADPALAIAGRTSAPALTGIDDTIDRVRGFEAVGADAVFVIGLASRADLERISDAVKVPLILGSTGPELQDTDILKSHGVKLLIKGHQTHKAAIQAIYDAMLALREGTMPDNLASDDLMDIALRAHDHQKWTKAYL